MSDEPNTVGARLRAARTLAGYKTVAEAAEAFGWNPATYRAHENDQRAFTSTWAEQYAKAFGLDMKLLTEDPIVRIERKLDAILELLRDKPPH